MSALHVHGRLDPNLGWDGSTLLSGAAAQRASLPVKLRGAYSLALQDEGRARLVRDPLGINKLFWAVDGNGGIHAAARPHRLVRAGISFDSIQSIPAGSVIDIDFEARTVCAESLALPHRTDEELEDIPAVALRIRETLHAYCAALAAAQPSGRAFVCLSGGLDSTCAALLALKHFRDVIAVSFDVARTAGPPSEDRMVAQRLAQDLGIRLLAVTVPADALLEELDTALVEAVDWRDFNVHAALVNVWLARGIADYCSMIQPDPAPLAVTGDLANEYMCDYTAEHYRGGTYYALPQLSAGALQKTLVRGLETSHREVGPFQARAVSVAQVYAPAVDHYLALPESFLADDARKHRLARMMFGDSVPEYVYARPKCRAQAGDADAGRGVLGVCIDNGIDQAWLKRRFAELHDVPDPKVLDRFVRGGRYRAAVPRLDATAPTAGSVS